MKNKLNFTLAGAGILFLAAAGLTYNSIQEPYWIYISIISVTLLLSIFSFIATFKD